MIIGMNLTFGPMHIIGLQGQPRRMYVWTEERAGEGFFNIGFWNLVASIGAFILAVGVLMFIINVVHTHRKEPKAPLDPWDARTLEWMTTSPPKEHNFDALPTVHALDEFFHRKYEDVGEGDHHDLQRVATAEEILAEQEAHADHHIHLPSPSYWPLVLAFVAADHRLRRDLQPPDRRRRRGDPAPRRLRLGARAVRRRRLRLRPAARRRGSRRRAGDGGEPLMSRADDDARRPRRRSRRRRRVTARPTSATSRATPEHGGDRGDRRDPDGRGARARAERRRSSGAADSNVLTEMPVDVEPAEEEGHHEGPHGTTGLSNNKLAMWLFLGSECLLFGGLISTYMLYRGRHSGSLGPDQIYDIPFTSVSSFVLLMSSLTMVLAVSSVGPRRHPQHQAVADDHGAARRDVRRRPGLRVHDVLPRGSRLHDEPVLVELLHAHRVPRRPRHRRHHHAAVARRHDLPQPGHRRQVRGRRAVGLYWHFVDIVWIVIFTLVYLIPA